MTRSEHTGDDQMYEVRPPDDEIARSIRALFAAEERPNPATVALRVVNGRVHLGGVAASPEERDLAIELARSVPGVVEVLDEFVTMPAAGQDRPA
jgi:osmotically-inducible protein OsmY